MDGLRTAAKSVVGPYGLINGFAMDSGAAREGAAVPQPAPNAAPPAAEKAAGDGAAPSNPDYSGTNTHESGVDEPDLVKTDGKRIVTVAGGRLTVVDAASRRLIGAIDRVEQSRLRRRPTSLRRPCPGASNHEAVYRGVVAEDAVRGGKDVGALRGPDGGTSLILVDLTGLRVSPAPPPTASLDARGGVFCPRRRPVAPRLAPMRRPATTSNGSPPQGHHRCQRTHWAPRLEVTMDGRSTRPRRL
jgi:hypothetical protein